MDRNLRRSWNCGSTCSYITRTTGPSAAPSVERSGTGRVSWNSTCQSTRVNGRICARSAGKPSQTALSWEHTCASTSTTGHTSASTVRNGSCTAEICTNTWDVSIASWNETGVVRSQTAITWCKRSSHNVWPLFLAYNKWVGHLKHISDTDDCVCHTSGCAEKNWLKYNNFVSFFYLLFPVFLSLPTERTTEPILTHSGSCDAVSCKEVPFGSLDSGWMMFKGQNSKTRIFGLSVDISSQICW